jgi:hypothetical protein
VSEEECFVVGKRHTSFGVLHDVDNAWEVVQANVVGDKRPSFATICMFFQQIGQFGETCILSVKDCSFPFAVFFFFSLMKKKEKSTNRKGKFEDKERKTYQ